MSFERPELLMLLLGVPLLIASLPPRDVGHSPLSWGDDWASARISWAARIARWVGGLGLAGLILIAAKPMRTVPAPMNPAESVAVMLVLDVSGSMRESVLGATPLERTRDAVQSFVTENPGHRIGVVTFAGSALTRLPPTTDTELVLQVLDAPELGVRENGSALGTAIGLAVTRLDQVQAQARAVLVVSDGLHNAGAIAPETATELARESDIVVHGIHPGTGHPEGEGAASLERLAASAGGTSLVAAGGSAPLLEAMEQLIPAVTFSAAPVRMAISGPLVWPVLLALMLAGVARVTRLHGVLR